MRNSIIYIWYLIVLRWLMTDILYPPLAELRIEKVSFISVTRHSGFVHEDKNGKSVYSLVYVVKGSTEFEFKGEPHKTSLSAGQLFFIPKNLPYKATYLEDNSKIKMICFDSPDDFSFKNKTVLKKSAEISEEFSDSSQEKMQSYYYLCSVVYKLLYLISKEVVTIPKRFEDLLPAIKELETGFSENRKASYYAALSNMSESNFRRLFKEYTGKSLIEYRNTIRLAAVNKMLMSGECTVSEAAISAGFNNYSFFYESYKKHFGHTPREQNTN